jgi:cbb3-type cytochrome oxidase subunit 3
MTKGKKIFLILVALFFAIIAWFVYDVSKKTIFPGNPNGNTEGINSIK